MRSRLVDLLVYLEGTQQASLNRGNLWAKIVVGNNRKRLPAKIVTAKNGSVQNPNPVHCALRNHIHNIIR